MALKSTLSLARMAVIHYMVHNQGMRAVDVSKSLGISVVAAARAVRRLRSYRNKPSANGWLERKLIAYQRKNGFAASVIVLPDLSVKFIYGPSGKDE